LSAYYLQRTKVGYLAYWSEWLKRKGAKFLPGERPRLQPLMYRYISLIIVIEEARLHECDRQRTII